MDRGRWARKLASDAPTAYSDASVTQLFYWNNWMHDRLYELGFTEEAGNFQTDNFSRGGFGESDDQHLRDAHRFGGMQHVIEAALHERARLARTRARHHQHVAGAGYGYSLTLSEYHLRGGVSSERY